MLAVNATHLKNVSSPFVIDTKDFLMVLKTELARIGLEQGEHVLIGQLIKLIAPVAAGGPNDIFAHALAPLLQAAMVVSPDLKRYVTLALPKQGCITQASRAVSEIIKKTVLSWNR